MQLQKLNRSEALENSKNSAEVGTGDCRDPDDDIAIKRRPFQATNHVRIIRSRVNLVTNSGCFDPPFPLAVTSGRIGVSLGLPRRTASSEASQADISVRGSTARMFLRAFSGKKAALVYLKFLQP
jgi:hypothetical protein